MAFGVMPTVVTLFAREMSPVIAPKTILQLNVL
jgi:hypothetical protein